MSAVTIRRADYTPPAYLVDHVSLFLDIRPDHVTVDADLSLRTNPAAIKGQPLILEGVDLDTRAVYLNGQPLNDYRIEDEKLIVKRVPGDPFHLVTQVIINPYTNTALQGLYKSGDMLCTQCEAEGFRRITWYPDRPDVMARFKVTLEADKSTSPVLLSNGNLLEAMDLPDHRHRTVWEDPFPKPSYLFAAVAGRLSKVEGSFTTCSGKTVELRFWVEPGCEDQVPHALASLKKAMAWDEKTFGREYDLNVFNVVAVSHFNMGAMENKSLNIFNSRYVLAKRETATDDDFLGIESVIAHEYFHNWTGDRVTCRDWFQLTLKEGLTVFRDQEFSCDMNSRALNRVRDVALLRLVQFGEDKGPMAHPIRPDSYQEINNFYTPTVYEKGAEVIRMIHTLLGPDGFRRGMDLYFHRHDGQAVTCEDFVAAMEDATGADLKCFRRWYEQAGTPRVQARWRHDPAASTLTLTLHQSTPSTPGQTHKQPVPIPVSLGLLGPDGQDLPLRLENENVAAGTTRVLLLEESEQSFVFADMDKPPVPSLLRGFSAPVILDADYSERDLAFLMAHDSDAFGRWDAGHELAAREILAVAAGQKSEVSPLFVEAWGRYLNDPDAAFAAEALALPSEIMLGDRQDQINVEALHDARKGTLRLLASHYREHLLALRDKQTGNDDDLSPITIGKRRLRNLALALLAELGDAEARLWAEKQFHTARSMTNQLAALDALIRLGQDAAQPALDMFYDQWKSESLVVNKWLGLQAMADWPDTLPRVIALQKHPAYDTAIPNKIYALIRGFAGNLFRFHRPDGAGYAFLADQVLMFNQQNPQVAARLVRTLINWKRYDPKRQLLMREQLERIAQEVPLSRDVAEIVEKALA